MGSVVSIISRRPECSQERAQVGLAYPKKGSTNRYSVTCWDALEIIVLWDTRSIRGGPTGPPPRGTGGLDRRSHRSLNSLQRR